ncbi:MAG TPA: 2-oxoacid:acceptor oxidoreductase subunit alpha [Thermoanaerobaculia bacterium]|nr:2-oxoacid:acceptor oxidoreductase subunit alpha [Thermoanaerobaculia bacterium]
MKSDITLSIVGSGGDGAVAAGDIISMACAGTGLHVIKTEAYGPQIRGGESSSTVRISAAPLTSQADSIDALVVFNWADFARFADEMNLADDCVVFYESKDAPPDGFAGKLIPVDFAETPKSKNIVAVGILTALFGLPVEGIRAGIRHRFSKKTAAVIDTNLQAFDRGLALGAETPSHKLSFKPSAPRLLMSGNEASALGALHAGCSFFAGYPITPSSEILHFLSEWLPKIGGTCLQTEDELAAIGAVVGASFAGSKAMTATSGPGLSLMAEMLGLSSIAEIPSVIVNVQRGGPSTGIPTKSEQSDLLHALFASHGDTPRVVLAPCDVEDAFHTTVDAFNIAEEYQIPAIVLSDQLIGQRRETIDAASLEHEVRRRRLPAPSDDAEYRRYADTEDGVSPMSVPGMAGGIYQTNGLEHDVTGRPSAMYAVHERMNGKRTRKMKAIAEEYRLFRRFGSVEPELGILCWGSSTGSVHEAIEIMNAAGRNVAAFVPRILAPLPIEELQDFVDSCPRILVIELSHSAQFYQYLRSQIDLPRTKTLVHARSGGKSLSVSEIMQMATLEEVTA